MEKPEPTFRMRGDAVLSFWTADPAPWGDEIVHRRWRHATPLEWEEAGKKPRRPTPRRILQKDGKRYYVVRF